MRKLSKGEGIAVWLAVIVVMSAFLFGNNLFALFSPQEASIDQAMQEQLPTDEMKDHEVMEATVTPTPTAISTNKPTPTSMNPNELIITDEKIGTGKEAVAGKTIVVNYRGTFTNGKEFDSSYGREPFPFVLGAGQVIPGWDQGFAGMKVGGKRKLVIPPNLAYGPNDYNGIPGNSTLLFEVELLDVK